MDENRKKQGGNMENNERDIVEREFEKMKLKRKKTIVKGLAFIFAGIIMMIIASMINFEGAKDNIKKLKEKVAEIVSKIEVSNPINYKKKRKELWDREISPSYKEMVGKLDRDIKEFDNDIEEYFNMMRSGIPGFADEMTGIMTQVGYIFNKITDIFRSKKNEKAERKIGEIFYKFFPDRFKFKNKILEIYKTAIFKIKRDYNTVLEKIIMNIDKDKDIFMDTRNEKIEFEDDIYERESRRISTNIMKVSFEYFMLSEVGLVAITSGATKIASLALPKSVNPWVYGAQLVILVGGSWYLNKKAEEKIKGNMNYEIDKCKLLFKLSKVYKSMKQKLLNMSNTAKVNARKVFFE